MKKILMVSMLGLSLSVANAQGIPTYDNAQVITTQQNFLKEIAQMAEQLKVAENQLNSFKNEALQMQKRLEGFSNIGSNFNVSDLSKSLDNLIKQVDTSQIQNILSKYNYDFSTAGEGVKRDMESTANAYAKYDNILNELKNKDKELNNLRKQFASAQTPQQREELENNIALEKMKMDNEKLALELEMKKDELDKKMQRDADYNKYLDQLFSGQWQGYKP